MNEAFSNLAIEQLAEINDPENKDSCVCARCKNGLVRRIADTKIVCEVPGCLDLDIKYADFKVENIMYKLLQILDEHKIQGTEQGSSCKGDGSKCDVSLGYLKSSEEEQFEIASEVETDIYGNPVDPTALAISVDLTLPINQ